MPKGLLVEFNNVGNRLTCLACGEAFYYKSDDRDNRSKKFCSRKCMAPPNHNLSWLNCTTCGRKFSGFPKTKFCTNKCRLIHRKRFPEKYKKYEGRPPKFHENRRCRRCKEVKHPKKFREVGWSKLKSGRKRKIGWFDTEQKARFHICIICERERMREEYTKNPIPQMLSNAKIRAKAKNIKFNINTAHIKKIWPEDNMCPVFRTKFEMGYKEKKFGGSGTKNFAPSLDRIEPKKGYVEGNVMIMSDIANRMKQDASFEQFEKLYKFLKKYKK